MHTQQALQAYPPPELPDVDRRISSFDRILLRPDIHIEIRIETSAGRIGSDQAFAMFKVFLIQRIQLERPRIVDDVRRPTRPRGGGRRRTRRRVLPRRRFGH